MFANRRMRRDPGTIMLGEREEHVLGHDAVGPLVALDRFPAGEFPIGSNACLKESKTGKQSPPGL